MNWSSDDERDITVGELGQFDIGRRVRFRRPPGSGGSPNVHGKLIRVEEEKYFRGNMPRAGYRLTVGFPSKWGGFNDDSFGPLPAQHPIWVGPRWVYRPTQFQREIEALDDFDTPSEDE